ncbi:MAG: hypothetical protein JXK07_10230 [Spirochaetes bacterium]|nr:hypothetical protein [Spirochaetota bacterium]MBN2772567.1 hypothetical protein [Spirochaetota bacterium]
MKRIFLVMLIQLVFLVNCGGEKEEDSFDDREYTSLAFDISTKDGFDDWGSDGAALGVAIDDSESAALIIAMKFSLPLYEKEFQISSQVEDMIENYQWGNLNSVMTVTATNYPFLTNALTNTAGIRTMNEDIFAILIIKGSNDDPDKYFVAVNGSINLTREDDERDYIEGDLKFVEITEASNEAKIIKNGDSIKINNINFSFDSSTQP